VAEPKVPLPAKLLVGGIAGMIGTSVIFPLDMVKTRMQNVRRRQARAATRLRRAAPALRCACADAGASVRSSRREGIASVERTHSGARQRSVACGRTRRRGASTLPSAYLRAAAAASAIPPPSPLRHSTARRR
jgi:hypothetical protein